MRTETIIRTLYTFAELSEDAQAKALDSARDWNVEHSFWHECVLDDAKECAALLGIEIDDIYFSGFWSQGDGACFTGLYRYRKGSIAAIHQYAPQDAELHAIARELASTQRSALYGLSASISRGSGSNFYSHEMTMSIDVDHAHRYTFEDESEAIKDALRDFARWIYRRLEQEYEYLTSDECVRESLEANECEFTAEGELA